MVAHAGNRSIRFVSGRTVDNRAGFAVAFLNKSPILPIPCIEVFAHDSFLPGFRHRSGSRPEDEPFPKCSVPFHRSSPFVNNSVISWEIGIFRRSASSHIISKSHVGRLTENLVLATPSIGFLPAPLREPPLPYPPIVVMI